MYFFASWPTVERTFVEFYKRMSLISSHLFLQQCPVCLVGPFWFEGGESCTTACLWGAASWICLKQHVEFLCSYYVVFSFSVASPKRIHIVVHKTRFNLSEGSDFYMIDGLSTAVHAFAWFILTSVSGDKILIPRYMIWTIHFRWLSL